MGEHAKKRVMLRVAYDGSGYCGWQLQPGVPTIEQVLNEALTALLGEPIVVIGASRTDTGVHSLGNVAVFDTHTRIPPEKISYALNQRLPEDIVVQSSCRVADDFHPRYCDSRKTYEYRILNREFPLPTERKTSYFYYRKLDVQAMQQAAALFAGTHDFASFCSAHSQTRSTVRTVYSCTVEKDGDMVCIRVTGAGFLYNMVRILAGTLIEIGSGAGKPEDMSRILEAHDRSAAGPTAPAHGLTMIGIEFLEKPVDSADFA
jgi:tRNA pseudouridine38-40 synthase